MNKQAFRAEIDREMKDIHLSAERIRRIHGLTDQKRPRARRRRRTLSRRLPAAALSVAVAAFALLVLFNRDGIFRRLAEDNRGAVSLDQGEGGAPAPTPSPTEAAVPADIVGLFEVSGLRFTLERAFLADNLVLFWRVESSRSGQAAFAIRDFTLEGASEAAGLPDELNGVDSLTLLGGYVGGEAMSAAYIGVSEIPIENAGDEITVSLTMPVYRPAEGPLFARESPDSDAALSEALDALNHKRLLLNANGSVTAAYVGVLENNFDPGDNFWSTRTYAQATLELAEKVGLVEKLGEASALFTIDAAEPMPFAFASGEVYSDPAGYDICFSAFGMTPLSLHMEYTVASNGVAKSAGRAGELSRTFEVMLNPDDEETIDERFPEARTVSRLLPDEPGADAIRYGFDYDLTALRLAALPEAIYLVPRSHTFYDKEGALLRDEAIRVELTAIGG